MALQILEKNILKKIRLIFFNIIKKTIQNLARTEFLRFNESVRSIFIQFRLCCIFLKIFYLAHLRHIFK